MKGAGHSQSVSHHAHRAKLGRREEMDGNGTESTGASSSRLFAARELERLRGNEFKAPRLTTNTRTYSTAKRVRGSGQENTWQ